MLGLLLASGLLLGVKHALEADHVAAVASLATRSSSWRGTVTVATVWGLGHAATLIAVGAIPIALGTALPERVARLLEAGAGVMLIVLGVDVLRRWRRRRVHFHAHRHHGGAWHLHAHAHPEANRHDPMRHQHRHPAGLLPRALLVGTVHGMAGSAALVVLAVPSIQSGARALGYLGVFGLGSILGMALFSTVISLPLRFSARHLGWASSGLEAALGVVNIALGSFIALRFL